MADNVQITEGSGTAVHADEFTHSVYGLGKTQIVKVDIGDAGAGVPMLGGAGAVAAGVQRVTLASNDPAVVDLAAIEVLQTAGNAILTTMDADTGGILTAVQIMDDWDESDRAKVNPIVGQAGVAAGAGAVGATVIRTTQASDSPLVTAIGATTSTAAGVDQNGDLIAQVRQLTKANAQLVASLGLQPVSGSSAVTAKSGGPEYETVAASQTDQTLGATGATGDYLEGLLCVVSTAATSQVQIQDGAGSAITVLPNNVGAGVGSYYVPLGLTSVAGAWQITTAAGVAVVATGDFT